ncbi:hypothetical protein AYI68_g8035 [Smittium mucronatum]|uniref:Uncharacterized protein n=1 Tax=Smittium mucronatum TaxID=133383 RepID=A0A1R0GM16_9FUNG|nr:hypothetical protein AYI68_g8035 [Smittium mucronatum]
MRVAITDLVVYPEFVEALPSIEENFYLTPLNKEERKEAIYSCPRSSSIANSHISNNKKKILCGTESKRLLLKIPDQ